MALAGQEERQRDGETREAPNVGQLRNSEVEMESTNCA